MYQSYFSFKTLKIITFLFFLIPCKPLLLFPQVDIEYVVNDLKNDLQFQYRTEKLMDGNSKIYLEKYSELPTGERRFIVIIPKEACKDQPHYCSMREQSRTFRPTWSSQDLGESYRSQIEEEDDLPIGAHLRWKGEYGKYIVNAFIDFDAYEKVSLSEARSSMDPLFLKVNNGMQTLGSAENTEKMEEIYLTINECQDFGVSDEKNDMVISMKQLKKDVISMMKNYEKKHGNKIKSASNKFKGLSSSMFFDLGGHLFTESHDKYESFNTKKKDAELEAIINKKYKDKKATPVDILEEALLINDHYMYDALLNCHNFMKRQSYALRDLKAASNNSKTLLDEVKKEHEETSDPQNKKRLNTHVVINSKRYEKQKAIEDNHLMNKNMITIRSKNDNEGAWYHFYIVTLKGFAERENIQYSAYLAESPQSLSIVGVGLEHYGKNFIKLRAKIADMVEYCWDRFGVLLGNQIHKNIPGNKSLFDKRLNDLKDYKTSFKNALRFPETPKHVGKAVLEGVVNIKNSTLKKMKEMKNGFNKYYQDFKNKW